MSGGVVQVLEERVRLEELLLEVHAELFVLFEEPGDLVPELGVDMDRRPRILYPFIKSANTYGIVCGVDKRVPHAAA